MCQENCKCSDKTNQMREFLEEIIEAYEYYQAVNGKGLVLRSADIETIKEILNN